MPTTEIYTLSLHDALPICPNTLLNLSYSIHPPFLLRFERRIFCDLDRKSTRLNSSHANISYAVFCLKQKRPALNASLASDGRANSTSATCRYVQVSTLITE